MKNIRKRLIALAALTCIAMTSFVGCSSDDDSSDAGLELETSPIELLTNSDGAMFAAPFQVVKPDENGKVNFNGVDINAPDPTQPTTKKKTTVIYETVTEADGQPKTEFVPVTDLNGQNVTEADGKVVTEAAVVTQAVTEAATNATEAASNGASEDPTASPSDSDSDYKSNTQSMYVLWIDLEKDVDYNFEGQFLKATLKIKDNIPEQDYPISIAPDLSTVAGKSLNKTVKTFNGTVRVGGSIEPKSISSDQFTIYADNVSAKPGDTIEYYININKNPGMAAMNIWFSYDSNAMECLGIEPCGEFAEISARTSPEVGTKATAAN